MTLPASDLNESRSSLLTRASTAFLDQQLAAPSVAIALVSIAFLLSGWFEFPSILVVTPVVAVVGLWMSLSDSRGLGSVVTLTLSLLWLFILWYALVQTVIGGEDVPLRNASMGIHFWRFQATFLGMVGTTTVLVILFRIFTRIRLSSRTSPEWSNACRWGLLDLMALSFGIAMVVAAINLRGDTPTITVSAVVATVCMLCVAFSWWSLSLRSHWRWLLVILAIVLQCYSGMIALNSQFPRARASLGFLVTNLPEVTWGNFPAVIGFFALMMLPAIAAVVMDQRLIAFPQVQPLGFLGRTVAWTTAIVLTATPIVFALLVSLLPWQYSETVRTAGWPLYYSEVSERVLDTATGKKITHIALDSSARQGFDVLVALVPLLLVLGWLCYWRKSEKDSARTWRAVLPLFAWAWFLLIYLAPSLCLQHIADRVSFGDRPHAVSVLTGNMDRVFDNVLINDLDDFKQLLSTPGGCRVAAIHLYDLKLEQRHLDRLAENHALWFLRMTQCELNGSLERFEGHPHLQVLELEETALSRDDQNAINACPSLMSLSLIRPAGEAWEQWPRTLEHVTIGCVEDTASEWQLSGMPRLSQVIIRDASNWWHESSDDPLPEQAPRHFIFRRCGSPWVAVEPRLPVHLGFEQTQPTSIAGLPVYYDAARLSENISHLCDLRSLACDDVSRLTRLEVCVSDCESLALQNPTGTASGTMVTLQGARLPFDFELDYDVFPTDSIAPLKTDRSERILQPIIASLQPRSLATIGMTVSREHLDQLADSQNVTELNLQGAFSSDGNLDVIATMKGLTRLRLIGVAPTDADLTMLLRSLTSLGQLDIDGQHIRAPDLSPSKTLFGLSLLTDSVPPFATRDLGRLDSLILGSQFANQMLGSDTLLITDVETSDQLIRDWLRTHRATVVNLKNAVSSFETLRGLDFSNCTRFSITPNKPEIEILKSWGTNQPSETHFFEQPPGVVEDLELRSWMNDNFRIHSFSTDRDYSRAYGY
ncbi:MAG: hypothetical protein AAFX06_03585 [Planctomycetota bacterium]